jgi:class 3 adenylate cyclase
VFIKFDEKLSHIETSSINGLIKQVEKAFPSCTINIVNIRNNANSSTLKLNVYAPPAYDSKELEQQVRDLTVKLRISQQKYLESESARKDIEEKYQNILSDVYPLLIEKLKSTGDYPNTNIKSMAVMFIDIAGFSQMPEDDRVRNVDLLRSLGRNFLKSEKGMYLNTWGDAVVAAFEEPASSLRCGCRFVQHLGLLGMDVRVGIAWGAIRISVNSIKGSHDIDGSAVNLGARLESAAEPGTVVCVEEVVHLVGNPHDQFYFREREVTLKKAVENYEAGYKFPVFEVTMKPNA